MEQAERDLIIERKVRALEQALMSRLREDVRLAVCRAPDCDYNSLFGTLAVIKDQEVSAYREHLIEKPDFPFVLSLEPDYLVSKAREHREIILEALIANASIRTNVDLKTLASELSEALKSI